MYPLLQSASTDETMSSSLVCVVQMAPMCTFVPLGLLTIDDSATLAPQCTSPDANMWPDMAFSTVCNCVLSVSSRYCLLGDGLLTAQCFRSLSSMY
jgi:hypothetical protein